MKYVSAVESYALSPEQTPMLVCFLITYVLLCLVRRTSAYSREQQTNSTARAESHIPMSH